MIYFGFIDFWTMTTFFDFWSRSLKFSDLDFDIYLDLYLDLDLDPDINPYFSQNPDLVSICRIFLRTCLLVTTM